MNGNNNANPTPVKIFIVKSLLALMGVCIIGVFALFAYIEANGLSEPNVQTGQTYAIKMARRSPIYVREIEGRAHSAVLAMTVVFGLSGTVLARLWNIKKRRNKE